MPNITFEKCMRVGKRISRDYYSYYGKRACWLFGFLLLFFLLAVQPALAEYNFEGVPYQDSFKKVHSGSVKGGVYVDGGYGLDSTPYKMTFNVPGNSVSWARLYVGVWGGKRDRSGTLDLTYNDEKYETLDLGGDDEPENVYCSGNGVYWVPYDVSTNTSTGRITAEVETGGSIDGQVYGIVLVAVYEDEGGEDVKYWIEEGNINLHGKCPDSETPFDELSVDFSGSLKPDKFETAILSVVYLCGSNEEKDYLYFNDEQLSDGTNSDNIANSKDYFDFKMFDVKDLLEEKNNEVRFVRGEEGYLHPVLAVLTLSTGEEGDSDLTVSGFKVPVLYSGEENIIEATFKNDGSDPAYSFQAALCADEKIVSTVSISSLAPKARKTVEFSWEPAFEGEHLLNVWVDPTDRKKELCEINNKNKPVSVNIIDLTPPEIEIEQPDEGTVVSFASGLLRVSGTVEDASNDLTIDVNGEPALISENRWVAELETDVAGGGSPEMLVVTAIDGANNTAREFLLLQSDSKDTNSGKDTFWGPNSSPEQNNTASLPGKKPAPNNEKIPLPGLMAGCGILLAAFLQRQRRADP